MTVVGARVSVAQNCTRFVISMVSVSVAPVAPIRISTVSVRVASNTSGDFAPKSARTVCASILNESAGAPLAGTAGTRMSVPRMICEESRMARGSERRRMLRAEGTPPTASIEPNGAGGGSKTKLLKVDPRVYDL